MVKINSNGDFSKFVGAFEDTQGCCTQIMVRLNEGRRMFYYGVI